jgi:hypothetical protein
VAPKAAGEVAGANPVGSLLKAKRPRRSQETGASWSMEAQGQPTSTLANQRPGQLDTEAPTGESPL